MRQAITQLVLIVLLFVGPLTTAVSDSNPDLSAPLGNDDYLVYSAVIKEYVAQYPAIGVWVANKTRPELLDSFFAIKFIPDLITATSNVAPMTVDERVAYMKQRFPSLLQSTVDDYLSKNTQAVPLLRKLRLPVDYRLVNVESEREHHRALYRKSKVSELVTLSRAGFSSEKKQALVFMTTSGGTDGANIYFLLTKTGSEWNRMESFECH